MATPNIAPCAGRRLVHLSKGSLVTARLINDSALSDPLLVSAALMSMGVNEDELTQTVSLLMLAQSEDVFSGAMRSKTIELTIGKVASQLGLAPEFVPAWLDQLHLELSSIDIDRVIKLGDGKDPLDLEAFVEAYAFSGLLRGHYAVRLVSARRFDDAWLAVRNAVLLAPDLPTTWRAAALVLQRLGAREESLAAKGIVDDLKYKV